MPSDAEVLAGLIALATLIVMRLGAYFGRFYAHRL